MHWRDCAEHLFCMCAAAQTADRGQEGGGAGHAGRGRNAARWPRSLQALLLCWLPAALLHWRRTQRGLASLLSSGMPGDNDTALHGTRVQPVRVITLACARDYGPKRRRQVHFHRFVALTSLELTKKSTLWRCWGGRARRWADLLRKVSRTRCHAARACPTGSTRQSSWG